jgi:spore coat polysaccharide biosynthesis protein SpsF
MSKIAAIVQARMESERLPGKVLFPLGNLSILGNVIERLKLVPKLDLIIVATTTNKADDQIEEEVNSFEGVKLFRGSSSNVLSRYIGASIKFGVDVIVRITADCPFIDPNLISLGIDQFVNSEYDIVSNAGSDIAYRTYPRGLDFEIFSRITIEKIFGLNLTDYDLEHVTPYLYGSQFQRKILMLKEDYSDIRITLDTHDDYLLIKEVYEYLHEENRFFQLSDIVALFKKYPKLKFINQHVIQRTR